MNEFMTTVPTLHKYAVGDIVIVHGRVTESPCAQRNVGKKAKIVNCRKISSFKTFSGRYYIVDGIVEGEHGIYEEELELAEKDVVLEACIQRIDNFLKRENQKGYTHPVDFKNDSIVTVRKLRNDSHEPFWEWGKGQYHACDCLEARVIEGNPNQDKISNLWIVANLLPAQIQCVKCGYLQWIPKKYLE